MILGASTCNLSAQHNSLSSQNTRCTNLHLTKSAVGDSLVREYSTVCASLSVIEQWISIYIARTNGRWTVIAWMDHGRSLEESPPGPWTSHIEAKARPLPVIQHHPKMAFRTTTNRLKTEANTTAESLQSTTLLPLQYDSLMALVDLAPRAPQDPLTMCIPLFAHAAFSEVQFLNLMESRIHIQLDLIVADHLADALGKLQDFTNILNRHTQHLKDSAHALRKLVEQSRQGSSFADSDTLSTKLDVPSCHSPWLPPDMDRLGEFSLPIFDGTFTPMGIMEDYDKLCIRCTELSGMCTQGISLAMNKATIEESRKAIEQSGRLKRLTLLATLFIPVSFSSSLMGMNIDLLGQNTVKFWWFFVLCVPITLMAYGFYLWDFQFLKCCWESFWKGYEGTTRNLKFGRYKKNSECIA
ncbi:uncharacterized protein N7483_012359 [Penicillium malachiteum]|uniref:uncharacterized protein n=1 Tax=Penicillium malachiteum TaxID=1324776 RepID=UPI002548A502|nr:uncharacterized protein N7483_012359 [Penicillium malachiteum]KAJ5715178.1 hypothetical protein N7483_012359 [Penicillium malachiteum]